MSIPLMEIKVDIIDPALAHSTLTQGSRLLFETPRHPKVLGDLVSESQWWFYTSFDSLGSHVRSVFSCFTSYLSHSAAHFARYLWPPPPTPALSVQFHLCR